MPDTPHDIQFPLADFDRNQLPVDQRGLQGDAYLQAIREHLIGQFVGQGGAAEVAVTHERVIIRWKESDKAESLAEQGTNHLKQGNTEKGIATLRLALERDPNDAAALFNLGMALGDTDDAAGAQELLERLVAIDPDYPGAWVALGVAQGRGQQWDASIQSFREAVARYPQDPFARKNLGAALSQTGHLDEARDHLKAAVVLLPSDPQAWLNLAMNLEQSGVTTEAETAYQRVITLDPGGHLSEKAEAGRNRITQAKFRKTDGKLRPDVVTYCGEAIRVLEAIPNEEVRRITMEVAMLGAKGLSVTDPSIKHRLRSLPGDFTGLHLLCLEYVGFKTIDPAVDIGFDIAAEYEEARRLLGGAQ
jgi:tetratricopeptide (TPR) repeat protein